jgi:hypothetical protein
MLSKNAQNKNACLLNESPGAIMPDVVQVRFIDLSILAHLTSSYLYVDVMEGSSG